MNNKLIIGAIAVIVIIGGGFFLLNQNNPQTVSTPSTNQPSATTTTQSSPTASATTLQTAGQNAISITNYSFSPATLTVKVGDSVTWTNNDSVGHSATADDNSFDTGILSQGKSGSITFSKAGTYTYHCKVHPDMKGTIVVQ